jgi:hypothetical protein
MKAFADLLGELGVPVHGRELLIAERSRHGVAHYEVAPVACRFVGKGAREKVQPGGFFTVVQDDVERFERRLGLGSDRFDERAPLGGSGGMAKVIGGLGPAKVGLRTPPEPGLRFPVSDFLIQLVCQAEAFGLGDSGDVGDASLLQEIGDVVGVFGPDGVIADQIRVIGLEAAALRHAVDDDGPAIVDHRLGPVLYEDPGNFVLAFLSGRAAVRSGESGMHQAPSLAVRSVNL